MSEEQVERVEQGGRGEHAPVEFEGRTGVAHPITRYYTPVLHHPCTPVTAFDDDLVQLVADMFASMAAADGVGLAANQIGVDARVFVVDCPDDETETTGENVVAHVVNPVLHLPTGRKRRLDLDGEGCLSVPGQYADLARPDKAEVTGVDVHGNPVKIVGTGLLARCLQHEADHLEGVVYVDRLPVAQREEILAAAGLTAPAGDDA
ncbi:peptide deformylase [Kineococcus rhizosphaerae]|uniref:peptide deformylase n=1 Tax=Kineococcus rhizosphaerae TaxID=559628 RepID=UPI000D0562E6|nr:peptide deformylase [Kineococcus rhizosphaerae]